MLAVRVLTAAVAVPLVVVGVVALPGIAVAALFAVLLTAGAWEWGGLLTDDAPTRWQFTGGVAGGSALVITLAQVEPLAALVALVIAAALVASAIGMAAVVRPRGGLVERMMTPAEGHVLAGVALTGAVAAMAWLASEARGPGWVLTALVTVWAADTAGYGAGRAFGRRQLAPAISPGKTWAGAIGGVVAGLAVCALAAPWLALSPGRALLLVVLGGWIAAVSIAGDLTLSLIKRRAGVKDTGRFFPGHGGVLDRLDGLIAALPWFAAGVAVLD